MGTNEILFSMLSADSFLMINKKLARAFGLSTAAVISELLYEWKYWKEKQQCYEGWFFSTMENLQNSIGFGERKQRTCIKQLIDVGFLEQENRGLPCKRYFRINSEAILSFLKEENDEKRFNPRNSSCVAQGIVPAERRGNKNKNKLGSEEVKLEIQEVISIFNEQYTQFKNEDYKVRKSDIELLTNLSEKDFDIVRSVFVDLRFFIEQHIDLLNDDIELTITLLLKVPFRYQQLHDYYNEVLANSLEDEQQYWKNNELRDKIEALLKFNNLFLAYLNKTYPQWVILHRQGRYHELNKYYNEFYLLPKEGNDAIS